MKFGKVIVPLNISNFCSRPILSMPYCVGLRYRGFSCKRKTYCEPTKNRANNANHDYLNLDGASCENRVTCTLTRDSD